MKKERKDRNVNTEGQKDKRKGKEKIDVLKQKEIIIREKERSVKTGEKMEPNESLLYFFGPPHKCAQLSVSGA